MSPRDIKEFKFFFFFFLHFSLDEKPDTLLCVCEGHGNRTLSLVAVGVLRQLKVDNSAVLISPLAQ